MISEKYSLGKLVKQVLNHYPSFRFRDKDPLVHNASDAAKDSRSVVYKALGYPESNPVDFIGQIRMKLGSWLENGIKYDLLTKMAPFGTLLLSSQGDTGEHGTFYGTSWHGYRDFDLGIVINTKEGTRVQPLVVEVKTKVGYGAHATIKESPFSKKFKVPAPDTEFGQAQQLGLYLRDAYNKSKNNPSFSQPIVDGCLLQFLFGDKLACFVEYYAEYLPESDSIRYYRVHCEEYPECSGDLNLIIPLKEIADRWTKIDSHIKSKTLPPPDFQRKYDVRDVRVRNASKKDLEAAIRGELLIGDMQAKYSTYRDLTAKDLNTPLTYSVEEIKILRKYLKGD